MEKSNKTIRRGDIYYPKRNGETIPLPRVTCFTQILSKQGLTYWMIEEAVKAAFSFPDSSVSEAMSAIYIKQKAGATRGTVVHSLTEALHNNPDIDTSTVHSAYKPFIEAYQKFVEDHKPTLLYNEQTAVNFTDGYAGTIDRIFEIKGKVVLADLKTTKDVYVEALFQMGFYFKMEYLYFKDTEELKSFPKIDEVRIILLAEDGTYDFRNVKPVPFETCLALKKVWEYLNPNYLESPRINKKS
jgi:hypothetical protein